MPATDSGSWEAGSAGCHPVAFVNMADRIEQIGVVGSGLMGSGITEVCARAGLDVTVVEASPELAESGRARLERSLITGVRRQKLTEDEAESALAAVRYTTDYDELADRMLVVEAITEDETAKVECFRILDRVVSSEQAILASNTSSIPIMKLATVTERPEQVLGLHFFNPVPVLRLVELVTSLMTSDGVVEQATSLVTGVLGKRVIRSQDRAGFVVNALLIPYLLSSVRMLESGFATRDDIDAGMVEGCAHPMGPLALCDLIGLDTMQAVAESLYEEFKEPLRAAAPHVSHGRGRAARTQDRSRLLRVRKPGGCGLTAPCLAAKHDRKALEAAKRDPVAELWRRGGELDRGVAREQLVEGDLAFGSRKGRSEAVVDSAREAE